MGRSSTGVGIRLRAAIFCALFVLSSGASQTVAETDPRDCLGIDLDAKRPLLVSRIGANPRVNFIKSGWEDSSCPADTANCRKKAYLVSGDLVLTGRTQVAYTCVSYPAPRTAAPN